MRSHLIKQEPIPDLVLFLNPSLESIKRRMGKQESQLNERYSMTAVENLYQSYQRFFYFYEDAPALIANTPLYNPIMLFHISSNQWEKVLAVKYWKDRLVMLSLPLCVHWEK